MAKPVRRYRQVDPATLSIEARMYTAILRISLCLDVGPMGRKIANDALKDVNTNATHIGQEALGIIEFKKAG